MTFNRKRRNHCLDKMLRILCATLLLVPLRGMSKYHLQLNVEHSANSLQRHIEVGDGLQMMIVDKDGIHETYHELKKD